MRKIMFTLAAVLLIAAATALPAAAITWGEPDTTHLNVGAMVVDWPDYGPWQWCSGTLIHPRVFLTAAHCTYDLAELGIERVWVSFERYALADGGLRLVEQVITHPDFSWGETDPHDVAVLILAEPVTDITPAPVADVGLLDELKKAGALRSGPTGAKFTNVGYGGSLSWPPHEIFYEDIRQVSVSEYIALTKTHLHLSQNLNKDDGGTCFGDSGGPTLYTASDGSEIVVAVVSTGDAACMSTALNYRVDLPDALTFIQSAIAALE